MNYTKSADLLNRAKKVLAGGVSSEFRKYNHPHAIFYTHGLGSRIYDADGNEFLDFTLSQGPLILGHSHPEVLKAVNEYSAQGQLYAGQHLREIQLAEKLNELIPSAELMRFCLDGSEAVQTAFRVARAKTGRQKFLRFEGHYHGWMDNVCWGISAPGIGDLGSREKPEVFPWTQGLPEQAKDEFIILPWNDLGLLRKTLAERHQEIAAVITEPIMCNSGCILPETGFLEGLRALCTQYGIALIFDEVITGFRVGFEGAAAYYGITPDIVTYGKIIGGGLPVGMYGASNEIMAHISPDGGVYQAGTLSGNPVAMAAGISALSILSQPNFYEELNAKTQAFVNDLKVYIADKGYELKIFTVGSIFWFAFTDKDIKTAEDIDPASMEKFKIMHRELLNRGVYFGPSGYEVGFVSDAHTAADLDQAKKHIFDALDIVFSV